jgi:hypothetical protein
LADDFNRYVQQFEQAEEQSAASRVEAEQARDYYDGNQFTDEEKAALRKRKQPITPENLIKPKVDGLCGLERQSRTDPKAWPRTQAHDQDAEAATDALRYVSSDQDLDIKISRVFENMMVEGRGALEIGVHKVRGQIDPKVTRIAWERIYVDPHACEADYSDAAFVGYITWMDEEKAKSKWQDKAEVLEQTVSKGVSDQYATFDDKPRWASWYDSKRKRVRVNTHYHLEQGVWHRCVFTLSGELEESKPVEFIDDEGNPECPLIVQAAYVDRENDAYGIVRDMIPLQDEVNKRRSKFLHIVNNRQVRVSRTMQEDVRGVRTELAKPDGVIVADVGEVEILGMGDMASGQFQLLADSRATLKGNIGPNATMQGKSGQDQSGRAILALQQAGMTEMTPLLDNLRHLKLRVFRQCWNRIRQYWTAERWVRVTDEEKNVRFVGLNVTKGHLAMQKLGEAVKAQQVPPEVARQYEQQIMLDPSMQQPANVIAELDVDLDIDEVNETPTLQGEQFEALVQLATSGMVPIPPELIIQASNLRDKQKLLDLIEEQKRGQQQPNQMQQLQLAGTEAQVRKTTAEAALTEAKAQTESIKPMEMGLKAGAAMQPQPPGIAA